MAILSIDFFIVVSIILIDKEGLSTDHCDNAFLDGAITEQLVFL